MTDEHPSPGAFRRNWSASQASLAGKVWLAVRNLGLRPLRGRACCGHPGEPGC